jgi:cyclopropane fatty-acyl-phospholipid synthase-like methyltransferase
MTIFRKLFFQTWYFRKPPWDTNQTPPELYRFIENNPPGRALDLGCGTGTNVITLAKHGWQVTGVDFIPRAIRTARRKTKKERLTTRFQVGDVTKLNGIHGPFDLILDIGCYHSLNPAGMEAYQENLKELLAPGGAFMIYLFLKSQQAMRGSGVTESDLDLFLDFMNLEERQDGTERGLCRSTWLIYRKSES